MTGTGAEGADEVAARTRKIAPYGLYFALARIETHPSDVAGMNACFV